MIIVVNYEDIVNYSRQREIILETLKNNPVHPTAEYLYKMLKKEHSSISLATLYRNLNLLAANGTIKKIDGLELSSHFDHHTHEHYHFICDKCKQIYDVSADIAPNLAFNAGIRLNADIKSCDILFHGICRNCK